MLKSVIWSNYKRIGPTMMFANLLWKWRSNWRKGVAVVYGPIIERVFLTEGVVPLQWLLHLRQPLLSNHQKMNLHQVLMWVYALGNCCRCIFMLYCVHGHHDVIVSIHVIWVILLFPCMRHTSIYLMLWRAPARPSTRMLARAVYIGMKSCRCAIVHQTRNSIGFSSLKLGPSIVIFS